MLLVLTFAGLATLGSRPKSSSVAARPGPPVAGRPAASTPAASKPAASRPAPSNTVKVEPGNPDAEGLAADQLPPGRAYTVRGKGTYTVLPGTSPVIGSGPLRRYVIEVEDGIAGVDQKAFARTVVSTLDNPRSWTGGPKNVSLQRVSADAQADFRVSLTTSLTVRPVCGYDIKVETSCWDDQHGPSRVYLNLARWVRGDASFGQDVATYHLYMINHEVGHAIGHVHTFTCLPNGLAPVMMQQTLTLKENQGKGPKICMPNAWPYPPGVDPRIAVPT